MTIFPLTDVFSFPCYLIREDILREEIFAEFNFADFGPIILQKFLPTKISSRENFFPYV